MVSACVKVRCKTEPPHLGETPEREKVSRALHQQSLANSLDLANKSKRRHLSYEVKDFVENPCFNIFGRQFGCVQILESTMVVRL